MVNNKKKKINVVCVPCVHVAVNWLRVMNKMTRATSNYNHRAYDEKKKYFSFFFTQLILSSKKIYTYIYSCSREKQNILLKNTFFCDVLSLCV